MPIKTSDSPSTHAPKQGELSGSELGASSIQYIGAKESRVPVPIVIAGLVALVVAIVVFLRHT